MDPRKVAALDIVSLDGAEVAAAPPPIPQRSRPLPPKTGVKWWICENENCVKYGHVATATEGAVCPYCKHAMEFLQQGGYPRGYERMGTPDVEEQTSFRGEVAFGRTRIVE